MAKLTIMFGLVLILLGVFGFVASGVHPPNALTPAWFGGALAILGFLATTEEPKKRMLYMHIAVTVGLIGFLLSASGIYDYIRMLFGVQFPHPKAVEEMAAMAALLLVFVVLCVRSFIAARRARA